MKKQLLAALLCFTALGLHSQYFTKEYGTATVSADRLADGTATSSGPAGHLIAGSTSAVAPTDLVLIRTNANGAVGAAPTFRNSYRLQTATGAQLTSIPVKVLHLSNGDIFVAGNYTSSTTTDRGFYTAVFSSNGAGNIVRGWKATSTSTTSITAVSACRASTSADPTVYITGSMDLSVFNTTLGAGVFVLAINGNTLAMNWSLSYNLTSLTNETAADVIASPYASEVVVIGNYLSGTDRGSFLMRVNRVNGASLGAVVYNYPTSNENVAAISLNPNAVLASAGYTICGSTNVNSTTNRMWVFKVNSTGTVVLANVYIAYSSGGALIGSDILTRQNTLGQTEYYASGNASNGLVGIDDMVVLKLSNALGFVGEFTYGKNGIAETNAEIAAHADGIGVYGNTREGTVTGNGEMYVAKAYFNGVTTCNSASGTALLTSETLPATPIPLVDVKDLFQLPLTFTINGQVTVYPICLATVVIGGSNARLVQTEETTVNTSAVSVYPNPVLASNPLLQVKLSAATAEEIELVVIDLNGREIYRDLRTLPEGESVQILSLSTDLAAGVYVLRISGKTIQNNQRFVLE